MWTWILKLPQSLLCRIYSGYAWARKWFDWIAWKKLKLSYWELLIWCNSIGLNHYRLLSSQSSSCKGYWIVQDHQITRIELKMCNRYELISANNNSHEMCQNLYSHYRQHLKLAIRNRMNILFSLLHLEILMKIEMNG